MEKIKDASDLSDEIVEIINKYSWRYDDKADKEDPWQETAFNSTFSDERLKNYYKNVFLIVED